MKHIIHMTWYIKFRRAHDRVYYAWRERGWDIRANVLGDLIDTLTYIEWGEYKNAAWTLRYLFTRARRV